MGDRYGQDGNKEQADEVCAIIRETVKDLYGGDVSEAVRIQYGGSVNKDNAAELFGMPDIDGGLVGGASLKLDDFEKIVKYDA
jgi:triosephosphate isomerase